jgi:lipopolysaccharide transport system ATP-binding protein
MYVRLAFAVAAYLEPEILLVDEVLAVGDVVFQRKCLGKMGEVAQAGRTVLLISHNMASIANLCPNAILLDLGAVVMRGPASSVIEHYITTAGSAQGEVIWHDPERAPGNELARLHSVRILQERREGPTADVDIGKEVQIEICYWCLTDGVPLLAGIWLKDRVGTEVLSSSTVKGISLTPDAWYGRPCLRGLYCSICCIPANFLNDKGYSITAIIGRVPSQTIALANDALFFQVHDTGEMRKEFYGNWLGVVRPRLAWQTEKMGQEGDKGVVECMG